MNTSVSSLNCVVSKCVAAAAGGHGSGRGHGGGGAAVKCYCLSIHLFVGGGICVPLKISPKIKLKTSNPFFAAKRCASDPAVVVLLV